MAEAANQKAEIRYPSFTDQDTIVPLTPPETETDFDNSRLFVAALNTSGELVFTSQKKINGAFSTKWQRIGTDTFSGPVAAGTTMDGRVAIVAGLASNGAITYIAEAETPGAGSARWAAPEDLGLPNGVSEPLAIALARGVNGQDNVFISGPDNNKSSIWWKYRNPPVKVTKQVKVTPPGASSPITVTVSEQEPPAHPWSNWININGVLDGNLTTMKATNNADGRIVLTGIYFNGIPWVNQQTSDNPYDQESWSGWVTPGYPATETVDDLSPILDSTGTVSVVASSIDGLIRSRQTEAGCRTWDAWSIPGVVNDNVAAHACAMDANGHLTFVVTNYAKKGMKNIVYAITQTCATTNQWTSWQPVSILDKIDNLALDYSANGTLVMLAIGGGKLSSLTQIGPDSTEWYLFWTEIADNLETFAVTRDLTPN